MRKAEDNLHLSVARYLRLAYPKVIFNTDLSGIRLTKGQAGRVSVLRSSRAFPDIVIYEPRKGYGGLFLELKRDGVRVFKKDGTLVADEHVREQAAMLKELEKRGFYASFAIGFVAAQKLIDWYLKEV